LKANRAIFGILELLFLHVEKQRVYIKPGINHSRWRSTGYTDWFSFSRRQRRPTVPTRIKTTRIQCWVPFGTVSTMVNRPMIALDAGVVVVQGNLARKVWIFFQQMSSFVAASGPALEQAHWVHGMELQGGVAEFVRTAGALVRR
jgi:hypothetical protein